MLTFDAVRYPASPGVYLMKDATGTILYVGKARELRKRLRSYLQAGRDSRPVRHDQRQVLTRRIGLDATGNGGKTEALRYGNGHGSREYSVRCLK